MGQPLLPPPAMTTSALSTDEPPDLEDQLERRERRDVRVVERRRNLDYVEPDKSRIGGRPAQKLQRLPRREAARGGDLRARRECRVEDVDVEGDMHLRAFQPLGDLARGSVEITRDLGRRQEQHAVGADEVELLRIEVTATGDYDTRRFDTR